MIIKYKIQMDQNTLNYKILQTSINIIMKNIKRNYNY